VRLNINELTPSPYSDVEGVLITPLHTDKHEQVSIIHIQPNARLEMAPKGGVELFVLQGSVTEQQDTLLMHSWLRAPIGYPLSLKTTELKRVLGN
jgi:hypothetical protein